MEKVFEEIKRAFSRNVSLDEVYAVYSNRLIKAAEELSDEYDFLREVNKVLEGMIVEDYMEKQGWYHNDLDEYRRWLRK